jgi:hypothetical protein
MTNEVGYSKRARYLDEPSQRVLKNDTSPTSLVNALDLAAAPRPRNITSLGSEILSNIASHLPPKDLKNMRLVAPIFQDAAEKHMNLSLSAQQANKNQISLDFKNIDQMYNSDPKEKLLQQANEDYAQSPNFSRRNKAKMVVAFHPLNDSQKKRIEEMGKKMPVLAIGDEALINGLLSKKITKDVALKFVLGIKQLPPAVAMMVKYETRRVLGDTKKKATDAVRHLTSNDRTLETILNDNGMVSVYGLNAEIYRVRKETDDYMKKLKNG